ESLDIIIINLIINAVDAMENGGEIKIDCVRGPETVTISISDTGIGISKEIMASIFNPFFTTKYNRNGGGLGLYIVYNETSKLNGTICVESEIGQGAKFILQLPARTGEEFHE
ncbi:MAG: HAMP domain-containing sensor histidine kinase, partial [Anaerovoracaceae bacterium]